MFGQPIKLSDTPAVVDRVANRVGEHTDSVLAELAGYSSETIDGLRARGVV
jgi:CoA:oxalate CoA-transferase